MLPDRFDGEGRKIERGDGHGGGGATDVVERLAAEFGDVVEGKKSWKALLKTVGELGDRR